MSKTFDSSQYTRAELKELADKIYEGLKISQQVDLEAELVEHYHRCKSAAEIAYAELQAGNTTAGAAAILTATTGALKELARMQTELYNVERLMELERSLTTLFKTQPNSHDLMRQWQEILDNL